jgi:hypothetical protein
LSHAHEFSAADRAQLAERGISIEEADRQLELLRTGAPRVELLRPATIGDGIERLAEGELDALSQLHRQAASSGRFAKFVPASGAATRMFRELLYFEQGPGRELTWQEILARASQGHAEARALVTFLSEVGRLPFHAELRAELHRRNEDLDALARAGEHRPILDALLGSRGLNCDNLPKGLLAFHSYSDGARTAFEEHLVEARHYIEDHAGLCRSHFTISPEHRAGYERQLQRAPAGHAVGFSVQRSATDTLAADERGQPLRDEQGRLVFRPGGHGALIENLSDLGADLVFIKNIDNVQPDRLKGPMVAWKRALGGMLVRLQRRVLQHMSALRQMRDDDGRVRQEALAFMKDELHVSAGGLDRAALLDRLSRPLRVCGMVPNTGEPGGGPFWVRGRDGTVSLQIVETAQVDPAREDQQGILRAATHFNPVDLACALRDESGKPFDLRRFVDPQAVIVTKKTEGGREIRALERPGLWNGAMAGWNTVFVEVPLATFSPVKSVLDLLREEHR